jgi:hypothetical protein
LNPLFLLGLFPTRDSLVMAAPTLSVSQKGLFSVVLVVVMPAMAVAIETGKEEIRVGVMSGSNAHLFGPLGRWTL